MSTEVYRDTGLAVGIHVGATHSTVLRAKNIDFNAIAAENRLIRNESDGSSGTVRRTTVMDQQGYSTLTATLSGGTSNSWGTDASFRLCITDTYNKRISSTSTGRMSGLAYPRDELVNGELPGWDDIEQTTMETYRKNR